jgi:hypothetical protein
LNACVVVRPIQTTKISSTTISRLQTMRLASFENSMPSSVAMATICTTGMLSMNV